MGCPFRLEVFAKNVAELNQQMPVLHDIANLEGFQGFNLPNKTPKDPLKEMASAIHRELPGANICVHYSCAYQKESLKSVLEKHNSVESVLVVSGSRPKQNHDSVTLLNNLRHTKGRLGVAFNPYGCLSEELARLEQKVKCDLVKDVWLQIGTSKAKLKTALDALRARHPQLRIYGSVLLPTPQQLQQWRFRPWTGTAVETSALASVDAFGKAMRSCVQLLQEYGATPLLESRVTPKNVATLRDFMGSRSAPSRGSQKEKTSKKFNTSLKRKASKELNID
eukprot:gnl/MRDRNA2_/MRDRNA2_128047_c0_seq1.p1 gnl/MRDRNA2_/MRDRNA2_128047_c0~~gnl/MRDRNA2_/MRDRNA2_128047_c0_seq1.p1  ORF type:complete len:316 (+),score=46.68 gnl/MRDRNA2_/MRDRNA2_128047_c0_seq1:111-950(+)